VVLLVNVLGWAGAACLLLAYGLASTGRVPAEGARFQVMNLGGALALTVNSSYYGAWPSAALNVVWIGIGVGALIRGARRSHRASRERGGPGTPRGNTSKIVH
jgi:hypothetical protein